MSQVRRAVRRAAAGDARSVEHETEIIAEADFLDIDREKNAAKLCGGSLHGCRGKGSDGEVPGIESRARDRVGR